MGNERPNGKNTAEGMPVERIARELDRREDGASHPRTKRAVNKVDKVVGAGGGWIRVPVGAGSGRDGKGRAQVDEAPREVVDVVGEGVADGDDDGVGLRGVDGLASLNVLSGGEAVGVAVCDVPGLGVSGSPVGRGFRGRRTSSEQSCL